MKKFFLLLSSAIMAVSLVGISPAAAQPTKQPSKAQDGFQMTVHTHSDNRPSLLFQDVDTLSFKFVEGEAFAYSSRTCSGNARFNDLGLNFTPDFPGVDDDADGTAPVRHIVQGTVTKVNGDQGGTIRGTITTVLCVTGADGKRTESNSVIVTNFRTKFRQASDNELRLTGTFKISPTESTGTFGGLKGRGSIEASLICLGNLRDPLRPSCSTLGQFTDFVAFRGDPKAPAGELKPGLVGSFKAPTDKPV